MITVTERIAAGLGSIPEAKFVELLNERKTPYCRTRIFENFTNVEIIKINGWIPTLFGLFNLLAIVPIPDWRGVTKPFKSMCYIIFNITGSLIDYVVKKMLKLLTPHMQKIFVEHYHRITDTYLVTGEK